MPMRFTKRDDHGPRACPGTRRSFARKATPDERPNPGSPGERSGFGPSRSSRNRPGSPVWREGVEGILAEHPFPAFHVERGPVRLEKSVVPSGSVHRQTTAGRQARMALSGVGRARQQRPTLRGRALVARAAATHLGVEQQSAGQRDSSRGSAVATEANSPRATSAAQRKGSLTGASESSRLRAQLESASPARTDPQDHSKYCHRKRCWAGFPSGDQLSSERRNSPGRAARTGSPASAKRWRKGACEASASRELTERDQHDSCGLKAQGSTGCHSGGNVGEAQRTREWCKALRSRQDKPSRCGGISSERPKRRGEESSQRREGMGSGDGEESACRHQSVTPTSCSRGESSEG